MHRFLLAGVLVAQIALSQSTAENSAFNAVSIKPSAPDARGGGFNMSPGRLTAKNQSLKDLVRFAYDIHDYQLSGGLGWTDTQRYEVVAAFPGETTNARRAQMMQAMLADRFALTIHRESKEVAGYALVLGRKSEFRATDLERETGEDGEYGVHSGRSAWQARGR